MTKNELSFRVATALDRIGSGRYAWEASEKCPQGHDVHGQGIRDFCLTCDALLRQHVYQKDWGFDCRIGRKPKDFTNPANLEPVVSAWLIEANSCGLVGVDFTSEWRSIKGLWCVRFYCQSAGDYGRTYTAQHPTSRTFAEAEAFLAMLESDQEVAR